MFSQNAMNNLKNKYSAVLKKCHLLNTFGSLAMAGMLCMGTVVAPCGLVVHNAWAADITGNAYEVSAQTDSGEINVTGNLTITSTVEGGGTYTAASGSSVTGMLTLGGGPVTLAVDGDFTIGDPNSTIQSLNVTFANWSSSTLQIKNGTTTTYGMTDIDSGGTLVVESGATYIAEDVTNIGTSQRVDGHLTIKSGAAYIAKDNISVNEGFVTNEGTLIGTDLSFGSGSVDVRYGNMVLSGSLNMNRAQIIEQGTIVANTFDAFDENTGKTQYYLTNNTILAVENITGGGKIYINGTTDENGNATTGGSLLVVGAPNYVAPDSTDIADDIDPAEVVAAASTRYQWVYDSINEANKNLASDAQLDPTALGTFAVAKAYGTTYETYNTATVEGEEIIITAIHHKGLLSVGNYKPSDTDSGATAIGFGSDSLLVVHAGALGDNYALTATKTGTYLGNINVNSGAKLLVSGVSFDNASSVTVNIAKADGYLTIESGAWGYDGKGLENVGVGSEGGEGDTLITNEIDIADTNNLYFDNALINVASYIYDFENNTYSIILSKQSLASDLPSVDKDYAGLVDSNTTLPAQMNKVLELDNDKEKTDILNGLSKTGAHVGAANTVATLSTLGAGIVGDRSSFAGNTTEGATIVSAPVLLAESDATFTDASVPMIADAASQSGMANGFALWLQPMYQNVSASGFDAGGSNYGYDTDIYGVSLGADYTIDNSIRLGLAVHMGGGTSESTASSYTQTKNDFDYIGTTLYAAYVMDNLSLSTDLGYTVTTNDVAQSTSVGTFASDDFDASTLSLGVRAEYKIESLVNIIPYIGARLNYSYVEGFNTRSAAAIEQITGSTHLTTFSIPVGVHFTKTMEYEGFAMTPRASLGLQFTMGDLDAKQSVALGTNPSNTATMESEAFDPVTFVGGVGLDFDFNDVTLALDYGLGASQHVTSHQVMAKVEYKF